MTNHFLNDKSLLEKCQIIMKNSKFLAPKNDRLFSKKYRSKYVKDWHQKEGSKLDRTDLDLIVTV